MKKQARLLLTVSAAALLVMGTSLTAFAANGWTEEDSGWVYYDKDGYKVTDTWKKSGDNWFYLGGDGSMALETLIEDEDNVYYVNDSGAMVANAWVQMANEDDTSENAAADVWYYFQANGKAYKASDHTTFKTINGKKYAFDSDGKMLYGWVDESSQLMNENMDWKNATYYCGSENDGSLQTGWVNLTVTDLEDDGEEVDKDYFFYMKSNGKKISSETKTINGAKYTFDTDGKMQSEWVYTASPSSTASASSYNYFNFDDVGSRVKGWFQAVPAEHVNKTAFDDKEEKWYYALNGGSIAQGEIRTINGKKYAFNAAGEMLSGLQAINLEYDLAGNSTNKILSHFKIENEYALNACNAGNSNYSDKHFDFSNAEVYYFGREDDDGVQRVGVQNISLDGDTYSYFFAKSGYNKGKGFGSNGVYTSVYDENGVELYRSYVYDKNAIYIKGKKVMASTDLKYQAFDPFGSLSTSKTDGRSYLVNTSGSIMKNKKDTKDLDENYYCTNKDGIITYFGPDKCKNHNKDSVHTN